MEGLEHHARAVPGTRTLAAECAALFAGTRREDRPRITFYGRSAHNPRDALWFARPAADGMLPLYRTYTSAYRSPRTTRGIARADRPRPMPAWMARVLDRLAARHGLPPLNHVVLHRYLDGADNIGWHHDKYMDFAPGSSIVSVSLGATRCFEVRDAAAHVQVDVADGDVVTLTHACNRRAKHRVRRTAAACGVRYSLTARTVDTHYDPVRKVFRHREAEGEVPYA